MRTLSPIPFEYNGVVIQVVRITDRFGRAWVVHEFPGGDQAELEDQGRSPARLEIEGFVNGPGWLDDLDTLRTQVEVPLTEAVQPLHHPFWGVLLGVVESMEVAHEDKKHDFAIVRLVFVEGRVASERTATQTAQGAAAAARAALADARAALEAV